MKKFILFSIISLLIQNNFAFHVPTTAFDMDIFDKMNYSSKAQAWFNTYVRLHPRDYHMFLGKYCACRIQEITSWLTLQRNDLNNFQNKLARIQYWDAIERKKKMESEVRGAYQALQALRGEANIIAQQKFTNEMLQSFLHYKSGKVAAAKASKLSFYTYCWSLLVGNNYSGSIF